MLMVSGVSKTEDKTDFYRPLSVQGIYQTVCVAEKIKADPCANPDYILAPSALYARQTAEIMHQTFPTAEVDFRDNLYTDNEQKLLYFLRHLDDIFARLLILGENPAILKLTQNLTGRYVDLKPSCCLCIHWPIRQSWLSIDQRLGRIVRSWEP